VVRNIDGESGSQPSSGFEDLVPASEAKTAKGDSKNTNNERGILNGSSAGVFM
jgi:hypothetical protein